MYAYIYICVCIHIYVYLHTCIHTHIHMNTLQFFCTPISPCQIPSQLLSLLPPRTQRKLTSLQNAAVVRQPILSDPSPPLPPSATPTQVNADHYKKLLSLVSRSSNLADNSDDKLRGAGAAAVFRLLARYSTFQGAHYRAGGFQVRLCE